MRFHLILILAIVCAMYSCNNSDTKERTEVPAVVVDTVAKDTVVHNLKTDFPVRAFAFKKMPDSTTEEMVLKYERFAALFVEYIGINNSKPLYSIQDQHNNAEAYNLMRDEMFGMKVKLKKQYSNFSKAQEARMDAADAHMNKFLSKEPR